MGMIRLVAAGVLSLAASMPAVADPAVVQVAAIKREGVTQCIPVPGALQPLERVVLHAKVTGYLAELKVDVGDRVKRGDVLAVLDIPEMQPQLKLASAGIAVAQANLQSAESQLRLKKLTHVRLAELRRSEAGAIAQQDVDVAEAQVQTAEAAVGVARAKLAVARADLARLQRLNDYATISAPFDAVVTRRMLDVGALVVAGGANVQPLLELTRADKLELAFEIPERLTWFVGKGGQVEYTLEAVPSNAFKATITRVSGSLRPETRGMQAEVEIDNPDGRLAAGMYATVKLPCSQMKDVVVVPSKAVRSVGGQASVFVVENGIARQLKVIVLANDGKEAVIGGELGKHAQVVITGVENLQDGQRIADQGVGIDGRNS